MGEINLEGTNIIGILVEGIVWGVSLSIYFLAMRSLLRERRAAWAMVAAACALLFFSGVHLLLNILKITRAFAPGAIPAVVFTSPKVDGILIFCCYFMQTLIGDAIIIYRTYNLWHKRAILLLVIPWLGCLSIAIALLSMISHDLHGPPVKDYAKQYRIILGFYGSTLATNLIGTSLLAYKVSKSNSLLGDSTVKRHLCHGLRTIVDAGLIYSAMLIVALVFVATKVNAFWIAEFILVAVINVNIFLIILRMSKEKRETKIHSVSSIDGTGPEKPSSSSHQYAADLPPV